MSGIGVMELLVVLGMPVVGLAVLFFVVRAAVRSGNRDSNPQE